MLVDDLRKSPGIEATQRLAQSLLVGDTARIASPDDLEQPHQRPGRSANVSSKSHNTTFVTHPTVPIGRANTNPTLRAP